MTRAEVLQMFADAGVLEQLEALSKEWGYQGWLEHHAVPSLAAITASDFAELFMRELQGEMKTPQDVVRLMTAFLDR